MTRRNRMLNDFDDLAISELNDGATEARVEPAPAPAPSASPSMPATIRKPAGGAWDWIVGLAVLGLVVLAARS